MGWRGQNAYDQEAKKRWRSLPWCERYNWLGIIVIALIVAIVATMLWSQLAHAQSNKLADSQIAARIVQESRDTYFATGHPSACPYDRARNGSLCGRRSAYSRPGVAEPKCYPKDVSKLEIDLYRRSR